MANDGKQGQDPNVLTTLRDRGEEAVNRMMEELGKNERVMEALAFAMEQKQKMPEQARRTLATQIREMRGRLERLEKRLATLEEETEKGAAAPKRGAAAKQAPARKPAAKRSTASKASASKGTSVAAKPSGKKASGKGAAAKPKRSGGSSSSS